MPIYPMECMVCGDRVEMLVERKDRNTLRFCRHCSSPMRRALEDQTVVMQGDIEPGFDESLGEYVGSKRELREKLAYANAYCPDLMMGSEPSAGRLTPEERAIVEGREVEEKKTIFDRRKEAGWDSEINSRDQDIIATEGSADYKAFIEDIKSRNS